MGIPPSTGVVVDPTTEICGADKTGLTSVILLPQITEKISTGANNLKPDPTVMDHTPTQLCQPLDNSHQHENELHFQAGNLISVPISYRLDRGALNEGHMTELTPPDTSRSFAWGIGPSGNNTQMATTWKRPT